MAVVGEEDDAAVGLLVAGSVEASCADLHGGKEKVEVQQGYTRAHGHELRRASPESLTGDEAEAEQGRCRRRAAAAARPGREGNGARVPLGGTGYIGGSSPATSTPSCPRGCRL